MNPLVRCKACGFITTEGKLKDKCPACGAPRAVFTPHTDPVSEKRRNLLNLTIHPIVVHFPQAFATCLAALAVTPFIFRGKWAALFFSTEKVLSLFLPLSVVVAISAGILDGKTRFKKIQRSPVLKKKLVIGGLFFLFSLALPLLIWLGKSADSGRSSEIVLVAVLAFGCSFILGLLGATLLESALPGN
jgi:uncharacterized membrane protein